MIKFLILVLLILLIIMLIFKRIQVVSGKREFLTAYTPDLFQLPRNPTQEEQGRAYLAGQKVVICGLLRNAEKYLENARRQVEQLGAHFLDYRVLLVENDSEDHTRDFLLSWAQDNKKVIILGCGGVNEPHCSLGTPKTVYHNISLERIQKMVNARNIYLDYIKAHFSDFDLMIVWDLDIIGRVYLDGIYNSAYQLWSNPSIEGIAAHGYRTTIILGKFAFYEYADGYAFLDKHLERFPKDLKSMILTLLLRYPSKLTQVKSAFNGFALYRLPAVLKAQARYGTHPSRHGENLCEHVIFHQGLKFYLNPNMLYIMLQNG